MVFLKNKTKREKLSAPVCVQGYTGIHRGLGEGSLGSGPCSRPPLCLGWLCPQSLDARAGSAPRLALLQVALSADVRQRALGAETTEPAGDVSGHVTTAAHLAGPGCLAADARPRAAIGRTSGAGRGIGGGASSCAGCRGARPQLRGPTHLFLSRVWSGSRRCKRGQGKRCLSTALSVGIHEVA